MTRCVAKTKLGVQCKKSASGDTDRCSVHKTSTKAKVAQIKTTKAKVAQTKTKTISDFDKVGFLYLISNNVFMIDKNKSKNSETDEYKNIGLPFLLDFKSQYGAELLGKVSYSVVKNLKTYSAIERSDAALFAMSKSNYYKLLGGDISQSVKRAKMNVMKNLRALKGFSMIEKGKPTMVRFDSDIATTIFFKH